MEVIVVTGSGGLVGSEAVRYFAKSADLVIGIDNDMRSYFFGREASTAWSTKALLNENKNYVHYDCDIRDSEAIKRIFETYTTDIQLIMHTASQPSHDWAAKEPKTDFSVNASGTLILLEATRQFAPDAVFIFMSTNKVYGDRPNQLPLIELEHRWEVDSDHSYYEFGIDESMSIDQSLHSLFGASKAAADVLVQEYGRYFGMKSATLRGGCLTGPGHSGAELHGFLSYLMKCTMTESPYRIFGYKGKQVRDNIHSADLLTACDAIYREPRYGEVYNIGGGRISNCSMLEAIEVCEDIVGKSLNWSYSETNRIGDHIWWVSDLRKFQRHYPNWELTYDIRAILTDIYERNYERWCA